MYRLAFLSIILLLLSACVPVDSGDTTTDPAMRALKAQAEMTGTAQANEAIAQAATVTAVVALDKSEREIKQAEKRLQIKETENAIENIKSTATAGVATMQAGYATSTSQAYSGAATQAAIIEETKNRQEEAEYQRTMSRFWATFVPISLVLLAGILLIIAGGFFWKVTDVTIAKLSTKETRFGMFALESDSGGKQTWKALAGVSQEIHRFKKLNEEPRPIDVRDIGNSGNTLSSPVDRGDNTTTALVTRWVEESEQKLGANSNRLLGVRELENLYADQFERASKALQSLGFIQAQPGKGTYLVGKYQCLFDLHTALQQREIKIRPSPTLAIGD